MSFCCAFLVYGAVVLFIILCFYSKFALGLIVIIFCRSFFCEIAWAFRGRLGSASFSDFTELPFVIFMLFSVISCLFLLLLSGPSFPLFLLSLSCLILIPLPAFSPHGVLKGSFVGRCWEFTGLDGSSSSRAYHPRPLAFVPDWDGWANPFQFHLLFPIWPRSFQWTLCACSLGLRSAHDLCLLLQSCRCRDRSCGCCRLLFLRLYFQVQGDFLGPNFVVNIHEFCSCSSTVTLSCENSRR